MSGPTWAGVDQRATTGGGAITRAALDEAARAITEGGHRGGVAMIVDEQGAEFGLATRLNDTWTLSVELSQQYKKVRPKARAVLKGVW